MPAQIEPNSGLFWNWDLGENLWKTGMDGNMTRLGRFAFHLAVIDDSLATPPASPVDGDTYIVAASATGDWISKEGQVTIFDAGTWFFSVANTGWTALRKTDKAVLYFDGTVWSKQPNSLKDEPAPELSADLTSKGFRFVVTDLAGNIAGLIGDSSGSLVFVYTSTGVYNPLDAGILLGAGVLELHGQQLVSKNPNINFGALPNIPSNGGTLKVDLNGNIYVQEDPLPLVREEVNSSSTQTVTDTPTEVVSLLIDPLLNTYLQGSSRVHLILNFEVTNNRNGTFFAEGSVNGGSGQTVSVAAAEDSPGVLTVDLPSGSDWNAGDRISINCWKVNADKVMDMALTGNHKLEVYQT